MHLAAEHCCLLTATQAAPLEMLFGGRFTTHPPGAWGGSGEGRRHPENNCFWGWGRFPGPQQDACHQNRLLPSPLPEEGNARGWGTAQTQINPRLKALLANAHRALAIKVPLGKEQGLAESPGPAAPSPKSVSVCACAAAFLGCACLEGGRIMSSKAAAGSWKTKHMREAPEQNLPERDPACCSPTPFFSPQR